ncbi:hypothetical protein PT974_03877 [Cladobotryum mycophilum]|uniref:Uncharacterized protein n=1 Tax=Cladobotryum mycophilum TaxID=491253 RepID=A0ABR0STJ6_9HYPO
MATIAKTIVATGVSSGLGFDAIKLLLQQSQAYKVILGARNTERTIEAFNALQYDKAASSVTVLPLELSNLKDVKSFSQQVLDKVGQDKIDYLLLNAGISGLSEGPGPYGSKWCEAFVVNHLSQHYLTHLLKDKLIASKTRIAITSSGAVRRVSDATTLEGILKAGSGEGIHSIYGASKFVQLLGAHWWRRELTGKCDVVAVSPGLVPNTGLGNQMNLSMTMTDAKPTEEGGRSVLAALTRSDFPEDPDQIFLTSWGEWWDKKVYEKSLDKKLQDKWSPSKDEIEKEAGISS